ncbi:MAG: ketopantoate reductase family protein [bacterium]
MKILVMGAGSMGCLLGGCLARAEHDVFLVDVVTERYQAIRDHGIVVEGVSGDFEVQAGAGGGYVGHGAPELVLVCVKSYDTEQAARCLAPWIDDDSLVLTLQNGVGNLEQLAHAIPRDQLLVGTTAMGANLLHPGHVHHAGEGDTYIGDAHGERSERAQAIARVFTDARLPAEAIDEIQGLIWSKLAVNVGINALTALLRVRNGRLLVAEGATRVMEAAVEECLAVAGESGLELDGDAVRARVKEVARLTASNRSSMLMDVLHERRTEIDAINGNIVRRGHELGVAVPVNEILTHLIHSVEALHEKRE